MAEVQFPFQSAASKNAADDSDSYTLPHPIWTREEVEGIKVSHRKPEGLTDRLAYGACMALRFVMLLLLIKQVFVPEDICLMQSCL